MRVDSLKSQCLSSTIVCTEVRYIPESDRSSRAVAAALCSVVKMARANTSDVR